MGITLKDQHASNVVISVLNALKIYVKYVKIALIT